MRQGVVWVLALATSMVQPSPVRTSRPLVGAIRWDAWHGDKGGPGRAVELSLSPEQWHSRLPFFAKVVSTASVAIDGATQEVMDQEIRFAADAGIDFWAFVTYSPDDAMSLGLEHYLASGLRSRIRFCLITEYPRWGTPDTYKPLVRRYAQLVGEPGYQRVLDGRPLVFVLFGGERRAKEWGGLSGFRQAIDDFRRMAIDEHAGNPYIVAMQWNPEQLDEIRRGAGLDAIGAYAVKADEQDAPFAHLATFTETFWSRCKDAGSPVVPTVMAGWDRRPRVEHPVPWETWQKPGDGIEKFYRAPSPAELAEHLAHGLDWVRHNPDAAPANTVLIYAWNENDEGGWIVPTLQEGTARLGALRRVLAK
jgi:hypothetical protein